MQQNRRSTWTARNAQEAPYFEPADFRQMQRHGNTDWTENGKCNCHQNTLTTESISWMKQAVLMRNQLKRDCAGLFVWSTSMTVCKYFKKKKKILVLLLLLTLSLRWGGGGLGRDVKNPPRVRVRFTFRVRVALGLRLP